MMDFDPSKENIQPLRGGRNVTQLEMALQAENNEQAQRELLQRKEELERAIQEYNGDDPLQSWYNYISWIEQSYPKQGHEGNIVPILEDCLAKFENDRRYTDDYRFCKLWIKYNDLQQNPLELYHMMHSRGLCTGCADLYKAWAYYHEVISDFHSADSVFQMGRQAMAQPYDELIRAHDNMIYAAGQLMLYGVDEQRLIQHRQALTTLHTYKSGEIGSIRIVSSSGAGTLPSASLPTRSNAIVHVFEDKGNPMRGAEAAPVSILSVAKRQVAPKENTIKPGAWTIGTNNFKQTSHYRTTPKFTVHEDAAQQNESKGLIMPKEFFPVTHEDFSGWKSELCYAEPDDPNRVPMYPKSKVYCSNQTEFSIEEIRASRYVQHRNASHIETQQAIQSILQEPPNASNRQAMQELSHVDGTFYHREPNLQNVYEQQHFQQGQFNQDPLGGGDAQVLATSHQNSAAEQSGEHFHTFSQLFRDSSSNSLHRAHSIPRQSNEICQQTTKSPAGLLKQTTVSKNMEVGFSNTAVTNENMISDFAYDMNTLWNSPVQSINVAPQQPNTNRLKFSIYEESNHQEMLSPKGSAMKTVPFKIVSDEDLAETGSRGGHDIAAAAQPGDGAKRIEILEDDSSSPLLDSPQFPDLNATCNTQVFNFNLTKMKVSTPQSKPRPKTLINNESIESIQKQLFQGSSEKKKMSTILEETSKSSGSTSSGSNSKSPFNNSKQENMAIVAEENSSYHFNLAQNLKANAALRTSVLEVMECESGHGSPVVEVPPVPIVKAPSDPFSPALLRQLLELVKFPERHRDGYIQINSIPRLGVRKEVTTIGDDKYYIIAKLGEGTYGQVFRAVNARNNHTVALKLQKPPNCWEYYICKELQVRLAKHPLKECFMDINIGYFSDQVSVFVSGFCPSGSLLDAVTAFRVKAGYAIKQSVCIYLCVEMLKIISAMHKVKIIHADIKPDNFLVYVNSDTTLQLQLIDFGCSIDMTFFPPDTTFVRRITTKDFICCEMQDGRPWNYHTDLFCVAATAHVLLFEKYMQLQKNGSHWSITQRFTRYMRYDLWNEFFSRLLNQQNGSADADNLIALLSEALNGWGDELNMEMRKFVNILNNR